MALLWLVASGCSFLADEFVRLDRAATSAPGETLRDGTDSHP